MYKQTHQLAAIMFTDIVGYTALMGEDEEKAFELLRKNRQIQKPLIEKFGGKWLKEIGDGVLASFNTVSDAVYCAGAIQKICENESELKLRIAIHLGEVVFEGDDVFGDGVNIASRLESLAPIGGILVSEFVHQNIQNKKGIATEFVREVTLKNVKDPVRIYEVTVKGNEDFNQNKADKFKTSNLKKVVLVSIAIIATLFLAYIFYPDRGKDITTSKPADSVIKDLSIAVLPFKNYSGDPEHEPFCDAMTDAVISKLAKLRGISKVTSMTSVMSYKQTQKTMPEIAAELGVTHILEANFQKSGNHVKINLQLIDGPSDSHFWSNEYNGKWGKGIFKIQAEVAENVARKIGAQITDSEIETIQKIPTNNEESYNLYIQAEFQRKKSNKIAFSNAIPLYEKAIALDSNFTEAYLGLAEIWVKGGLVLGIYNEQEAWQNTKKLSQKALEIDSTNVRVYDQLFIGYFYYDWDFKSVEKYYQTILHRIETDNIGPVSIDYLIKTGRYNEALENINKKILFNPSIGNYYSFKAEILMFLGKIKEAIQLLVTYDPLYNDDWFYLRSAAKFYYYLGEYEKSKKKLNRMMSNFPNEDPPILFWLNAVHQQMDGNSKGVAKYLVELNEKYQNNTSGSPAWFIALYYCHIKDYERAFEWLQKSYDRHEVEMTWFREEPLLIPIRDDPRYKEIYRKIGFPD